ncbi:MAG TPA: hypothetical protein PKN62_02780 [bacterium]|nr:hypothetical protein [bacterium]
MNHLPKVKFVCPEVEREAKILFNFCHQRPTGWDWSERIYKHHPELKQMLAQINLDDKDAFQETCLEYAKKYIKENEESILAAQVTFQKEWDEVGDKYLQILSEHFETNYPSDIEVIKAYVSISPICPRYLDNWSFAVNYNRPEYLKKVATHEILHFLYFKKWLEVFPETTRKEMDSPYLVWKLSEIIAPIVLNYHPEIQKIVNVYSPGYKEFQDIEIFGKKLISYFEDLYKKHLASNDAFDQFLKTCWQSVDEAREIIEKI